MPYGTGKQNVNIGTNPNDGTGDSLRAGADKINDNTDEVYGALGNGSQLLVNVSGAATVRSCVGMELILFLKTFQI